MSFTKIMKPRWVSASFVPPFPLPSAAVAAPAFTLALALLPQMSVVLTNGSGAPRSTSWTRTASCWGKENVPKGWCVSLMRRRGRRGLCQPTVGATDG